MDPSRYLERRLGPWSSHPTWQKRRRRTMMLLSLLPLGIVFAIGLLIALNYENWVGMFRHAGHWVTAIMTAVAMALAVFVTMGLVARWAEIQRLAAARAGRFATKAFVERWALALSIVFGALGPLVALTAPGLPPAGRFLLHLSAVLPFLGLLVGMWVMSARLGGRTRGSRRPVLFLLLVAVLAVLALTLLHDLSLAWKQSGLRQGIAGLIPWYVALEKPFLGVVLLAPIALVVWALWEMWRGTAPASSAKARARGSCAGSWAASAVSSEAAPPRKPRRGPRRAARLRG